MQIEPRPLTAKEKQDWNNDRTSEAYHCRMIYDRLYAYYMKQHINDRQMIAPIWNDVLDKWGAIAIGYFRKYSTHHRFLQRNRLRLKLITTIEDV